MDRFQVAAVAKFSKPLTYKDELRQLQIGLVQAQKHLIAEEACRRLAHPMEGQPRGSGGRAEMGCVYPRPG